jgi:predicted AlkP superfamily pyrophosphatase or phosphodiesterase
MRSSGWSAVPRWVLAAAVLVTACSARTGAAPRGDGGRGTTVLLVSIDGFRWDYLDRGLTPNLSRLAREGVRAEALVPVFPTKTYPNHYTIVTGRYPANHGIVGNVLTAPDIGRRLTLWDREAVRDAGFYLAEPIWVTAERQGPPERRPVFLTLYFNVVDNAGHDYGPDAPETDAAIARADTLVGLVDGGLARIGRRDVNLVVVSDHGMTSTGPGRVLWLDEYVAPDAMVVDEMSTLLTAWPASGEEGWTIAQRTDSEPSPRIILGNHGYDDRLPSMRAIFVARGPAFRQGVRVPAFRNIHLYALLAEVLAIEPQDSDGSLDSVRTLLSRSGGV